jgi:hypothetical protein
VTRRVAPIRAVLSQLPFMRVDVCGDLAQSRNIHMLGVLATEAQAADRYARAVAADPELAEQVRRLLGHSVAGRWRGYIPPRTFDAEHGYNTSPYRQQLVALVVEALRRAGDLLPADADRLAAIPQNRVRAPWAEARTGPSSSPTLPV